MDEIWTRNHTQLPSDIYSAHVFGRDDGTYQFRAYPARGDHCTESYCMPRDEAIAVAETWLEWIHGRGPRPERIYSAAY